MSQTPKDTLSAPTNVLFLKLVSSALQQSKLTAADIPVGADWDALMSLAKNHTVLGLIADAVFRLPDDRKPSKEVQTKLLTFAARNLQIHSLLNNTLAQIVTFYREHGIESVLLKGQGVALSYPTPELRQCGDIDLYIGAENYERSKQLAIDELHADGEEEIEDGTETVKHYTFRHGKVTIEIHRKAVDMTDLIHKRSFEKWVGETLSHQDKYVRHSFCGVEVNMPSADFNALYIFYHAWHHLIFEGVGIRQLCDWTMYMQRHNKDIDHQLLKTTLCKYGLMRPWQYFAYIAVNYLGCPEDLMPFYTPKVAKKAQLIARAILRMGNFGFYDSKRNKYRDVNNYMLRKIYRLGNVAGHFYRVASISPLEAVSGFVMRFRIGTKTILRHLSGKPEN